jgi:hypothetical protein
VIKSYSASPSVASGAVVSREVHTDGSVVWVEAAQFRHRRGRAGRRIAAGHPGRLERGRQTRRPAGRRSAGLVRGARPDCGFKVDDSTARLDMSAVWLSLPTTTADVVGFAGGVPGTRTYATPVSVAGTTLRVHEARSKARATAAPMPPTRRRRR